MIIEFKTKNPKNKYTKHSKKHRISLRLKKIPKHQYIVLSIVANGIEEENRSMYSFFKKLCPPGFKSSKLV